MTQYVCDSLKIEKNLKKLERIMVSAGARFHEALTIRCRDGEFSTQSSLPPEEKTPLIFLPQQSLPPLDKVHFSLSGDDLQISSTSSDFQPHHKEIMETVVEIVNLSGKITQHKASSPWFEFSRTPELLNRLLEGRQELGFPQVYLQKYQSGDIEQVIIHSYFKTRTIKLDGNSQILMPFIDFANHHSGAANYKFKAAENFTGTLSLLNSKLAADTKEVYVNYGIYDVYDLFINFGFVDESPFFVRSVPVTLYLDNLGKINVKSLLGFEVKEQLAPPLADLGFYLPVVLKQEHQILEVSHLLIPSRNAPNSLRRILFDLVQKLGEGIPQQTLVQYVEQAERQILKANVDFYKNLNQFLTGKGVMDSPSLVNALQAIHIQTEKILNYKSLMGIG